MKTKFKTHKNSENGIRQELHRLKIIMKNINNKLELTIKQHSDKKS